MSADKSKRKGKTVIAKKTESALSVVNRFTELEDMIFELRGEKVLLDSEVAILYGVPTKRMNEAVFRNRGKFPRGYVVQLTAKEWRQLKSQDATST